MSEPTGPTVETRLEKVEDQLSDWNATCRIRAEGFPTLTERDKEVLRGGRELWNLKVDLARVLWTDVSLVLKKVVSEQEAETMGAEFAQAFGSEGDLQGVFGVGCNIDNAKTFDVRFKPSLSALRAHALIKSGSRCQVESPVANVKDRPPPQLLRVLPPLLGRTAVPAQGGMVGAGNRLVSPNLKKMKISRTRTDERTRRRPPTRGTAIVKPTRPVGASTRWSPASRTSATMGDQEAGGEWDAVSCEQDRGVPTRQRQDRSKLNGTDKRDPFTTGTTRGTPDRTTRRRRPPFRSVRAPGGLLRAGPPPRWDQEQEVGGTRSPASRTAMSRAD